MSSGSEYSEYHTVPLSEYMKTKRGFCSMIQGCRASGTHTYQNSPAIDGLYIIVQPTPVLFSRITGFTAKLFALLIIPGPFNIFFVREEHLKGIGWMLDSGTMSTYTLLYSPVT